MTNSEFAALLNEKAGLSGPDALTIHVIRQWVAWDILPKAKAIGRVYGKGPEWSRTETSLRRAMRLAELRKRGVRRQHELIVQAYLEWGHSDFDRVREALVKELGKWRAQLVHRRTTYMDNKNYADLGQTQKRAIRTQIGRLDSRFIDTPFQQSDAFYATFAELAHKGKATAVDQNATLLQSAAEQILPGIDLSLFSASIEGLANLWSGVMGTEDEIEDSAESEIKNASQREFRIARALNYRIGRMPRQLAQMTERLDIADLDVANPLRAMLEMQNSVAKQTSTGPWPAMRFVQCILAIRRGVKCPEI